MTIHSGHPFAVPPEERDAARRLRGRLASSVTLWLTGRRGHQVGLTVSSLLVALGEPPRIVGLVDPDSDLADALVDPTDQAHPTDIAHPTDPAPRFTVVLLTPGDHGLAEAFAGLAPAPGGLFRAGFADTDWGPVVPGRSWAGVRFESARPLGWSTEVVGVIEQVALVDDEPLVHLRGAYRATR